MIDTTARVFIKSLVIIALLQGSTAAAATITAPSCSQPDVQAAINAAANGDTVAVPAGTCAWTTYVSWANKSIHLRGAGIGNTVIVATQFAYVEASAQDGAAFRISDFTFTHDTAVADQVLRVLNLQSSTFTKGWRIDHNRFLYSNGGHTIAVYGLTWGVIDHGIWDTTAAAPAPFFVYGYASGEDGTAAALFGKTYWNRPMNLGTDEAVYFEDNQVNYAAATNPGVAFVFDEAYGGSVVMRHNVVSGVYVQAHSTRNNSLGGMKYEVYGNIFTESNLRFAQMRSGSGVFFNNQVTGAVTSIDIDSQHIAGACYYSPPPVDVCSATNPFDGAIEPTGWPCLGQPGRGGQQASVPLYSWNNGTSASCATGGTCDNNTIIALNGPCVDQAAYIKSTPHANGEVDFVNNGSTPKPGYTPYVYPHPLVSGAPAPLPPTNLRIVQD